LDEEPRVYEMFKIQEDVCARAVFTPEPYFGIPQLE
jgi:hypothetical protein